MNESLLNILDLSLELETAAMRFYQTLAEQSPDEEQKNFWRELARQEGSHLQYWKTLKQLAESEKIENLFDHPTSVLNELQRLKSTCEQLVEDETVYTNIGRALITAVRLEFHMLHPAFEAMFHLYEKNTGDPSPEKAYHMHLRFIMGGFARFASETPEYSLIADMLLRIWEGNQQIARTLGEVQTLRGLIPICMHCKKVRDPAGYWSGVEDYIQSRADVRFSHGICDSCMSEHFPEMDEK